MHTERFLLVKADTEYIYTDDIEEVVKTVVYCKVHKIDIEFYRQACFRIDDEKYNKVLKEIEEEERKEKTNYEQ